MKQFIFIPVMFCLTISCASQAKKNHQQVNSMDALQLVDLPAVKIGSQTWSATNISLPVKGVVCYENNPENCKVFGPLYTYAQAIKVAKRFPGWRLPTKADVDTLIAFLGGADKAGKELKEGGSSGFNALLAGYREAQNDKFYRINEQTGFWTSTAEDAKTAWKFYLTIEDENINFHPVYKKYGDSVRLIKID